MENKESAVKKLEAINIVWGAFGTGEECTGVVERIDRPETGGIFTKYFGCNYLFNGYPDISKVEAIAIPKKIIFRMIGLMSQGVFQFVFSFSFLAFLILPKSLKKKLFFLFYDFFANLSAISLKRHLILPNKYCVVSQEIRRAFLRVAGDNDRSISANDIFSMMVEYDYAYRARLQDFLPFLDKEKLKKNSKKEISRVLEILAERDSIDYSKRWRKLKMMVGVILLFKEVKDFVVRFLLELDLEKIKMTETDWYYVLDRKDYNYGGLSHEERLKQKPILDAKVGNKLPKIIFKEKV